MSDPVVSIESTPATPNCWIGVRIKEPPEGTHLSKARVTRLKQNLRTKRLAWLKENREEVLLSTATGLERYYEFTVSTEEDGDILLVTFSDWSSKDAKRELLRKKLHSKINRNKQDIDPEMKEDVRNMLSKMSKTDIDTIVRKIGNNPNQMMDAILGLAKK